MNLSMTTSALASALRTLEKITPAKAVLPILSHVLINAESNHVVMSCTDTELSLSRSCDALVNAPGLVALPCKPLMDIVSQITEPDVHLFVEKNSVRIAAGHFKMRLQAMSADAFPTIPISTTPSVLINGATLRRLINKVRPCIGTTEKRYNINGALLVLSESILALVTTDGKRLAVATATHSGTGATSQVILPTRLLDTLAQDDGDDYAYSTTDNQLFFATEQSILTSRKIEGQFPNYQRIIPENNPFTLTAARDVLQAALKRVSLASGETRTVQFKVSPGVLQLQAKSVGLGEAIENVEIGYQAAETSVNLHAQAILDFLDSAQQTSVTLAMNGPTGAVLLSDGTDFITVAMSVRQ